MASWRKWNGPATPSCSRWCSASSTPRSSATSSMPGTVSPVPAAADPADARANEVVVGRAMPVLMIDVLGTQKKPFGMLTEALDRAATRRSLSHRRRRDARVPIGASSSPRRRKSAARSARSSTASIATRPRCWSRTGRSSRRGRFAQDSSVRTAGRRFPLPDRSRRRVGRARRSGLRRSRWRRDRPETVENEVITQSSGKGARRESGSQSHRRRHDSTEAFKKFGIL